MSKFLHITCLAIAGSTASFATLTNVSQSHAEDIKGNLPVIGTSCNNSGSSPVPTPTYCDGKKVIALCYCGKWRSGDGWVCDEHGQAMWPNTAVPGCDPQGNLTPGIGFIGVAKSGFREKIGLSVRNF